MTQVHKMHNRDPNFPLSIIDKIEEFLGGSFMPEESSALVLTCGP
jgi:hypothetical protein